MAVDTVESNAEGAPMGRDWAREAAAQLSAAGWDAGHGSAAREHAWAVREESGLLLLGGIDHGEWRIWRTFAASAAGAEALVQAVDEQGWTVEPEEITRTAEATQRASDLGVEMLERAAGWAARSGEVPQVDVLPAQEVKVGTPLEHVGHPTGHVLHHFGTPAERKALPGGAAALPVTTYLLVHPLRPSCRVERVPAAEGQPGGAWRILLDAPIATYVGDGALRPFVPRPG